MPSDKIPGETVLRTRRPSASRRAVMDAVATFHDPFAISEVLAKTRQLSSAVGRSTVYRALAWMEKHRRLRRMTTPSGRSIFVASHSAGACVVECPRCGATLLLEEESLAARAGQLAADHGFTLVTAQWAATAICSRHEKVRRM